MYPDPDTQAEQFDEALERRQTGEDPPADDPEIRQLVDLASRLERELPEDTPDPAFRASLKQQLLGAGTPVAEPVDLAGERWRRAVASPWRLSAAAAAVLVVGVVAVMFGVNPLGGDDESSETAPFQSFDQDENSQASDSLTGLTGTGEEDQTWFAGSFPPFDGDHIVLPPFLSQLLARDEEPEPEVELDGADEMIADAEMPESAPVLYLSAPSNTQTMLTTLSSTLGINGEIQPAEREEEPFQVLNQQQEPVVTWDPQTAFFEFRGELLDQPFVISTEQDAGPAEIAVAFLQRIGFDLVTIQYEHEVNEVENGNEVEFRPSEFPEMGLELSLGGRVVVGFNGEIHQAEMFWLSLIERRTATLREPDEILQDIEGGEGYSPPVPDSTGDDRMRMDVNEAGLTHVLTRMDEGRFVLQPAMALSGEYQAAEPSEVPLVAQYVVPAVSDED